MRLCLRVKPMRRDDYALGLMKDGKEALKRIEDFRKVLAEGGMRPAG